jgi:hypothetical protein
MSLRGIAYNLDLHADLGGDPYTTLRLPRQVVTQPRDDIGQSTIRSRLAVSSATNGDQALEPTAAKNSAIYLTPMGASVTTCQHDT